MDGEDTGGKDEETPQAAGSQQIPHDWPHTSGVLARAKNSSQSGDGEHGDSAMLGSHG